MRESCAWIAVGPLGHYCVSCPTMSQLVTFAPFVPPTFDQKSTSCRQGNPSTWILYFKTDRMSFDYYVSCPTMSQLVTYWSCSSPPHSLTKNYNLKTRYSADWDFYFKRDRMSFDQRSVLIASWCFRMQDLLSLQPKAALSPAPCREEIFCVLHSVFCSEEMFFIFYFAVGGVFYFAFCILQ